MMNKTNPHPLILQVNKSSEWVSSAESSPPFYLNHTSLNQSWTSAKQFYMSRSSFWGCVVTQRRRWEVPINIFNFCIWIFRMPIFRSGESDGTLGSRSLKIIRTYPWTCISSMYIFYELKIVSPVPHSLEDPQECESLQHNPLPRFVLFASSIISEQQGISYR